MGAFASGTAAKPPYAHAVHLNLRYALPKSLRAATVTLSCVRRQWAIQLSRVLFILSSFPMTRFFSIASAPFRFLLLLVLAGSLTGCFSSGAFFSGHLTDVQLQNDNYEIVATNVEGTATAGYLLGISGGLGPSTTAVAVARVSGDESLYKTALENLWANVEAQTENAEGRSLALVNVRYDVSALNLILYTAPTVTVRADVVEFIE